jgi:hypothetical protein
MGPHTIFDKSFLQSLTVDESVWFDAFFTSVITPLFYVETLADLEKDVREGRTPEQEVSIIADKFPQMSGHPCIHHTDGALGELLGHTRVPMTGQIPMPGGRRTKLGDRYGIVWERSREAEAFSRWQEGRFREIERDTAKEWRARLEQIDLESAAEALRRDGRPLVQYRSLSEAAQAAKDLVASSRTPFGMLGFVVRTLNVPRQFERPIIERWHEYGRRTLLEHAPYAAHIAAVELFLHLALASGLIGTARSSNRVDVAYLNYIPFCKVFVSSDTLHRRTGPLFLRPDQIFVWGPDLKSDLRALNEHYSKLPQGVRESGVMGFATYPPDDCAPLVATIWDKVAPGWRSKRDKPSVPSGDPDRDKKLVDEVRRFEKAPPMPAHLPLPEDAEVTSMTIKRAIRRKRGSWWQIGKDVPASKE